METLTEEAVRVLLSGISWKWSEGAMEYEDWPAIKGFLEWAKAEYPNLIPPHKSLFDQCQRD